MTRLVKTLKTLGLFGLCVALVRRLGLLRRVYATYADAMARHAVDPGDPAEAEGLPVPPVRLRLLVAGPEAQKFLAFGAAMFQLIADTLEQHGAPVRSLDAVLDFGCGSGRVLRHWQAVNGPQIYGTDYNKRPVAWCQRNLPFARCSVNALSPPLDYGDGTFDCVYAVSVFTHLSEALQQAWLAELVRIIRPGGWLLLTTHGEHRFGLLTERQRNVFRSGRLVVTNPEASGTNLCNAFHPEAYVRSRMTAGCSVEAFVPGGTRPLIAQDVYLMRKNG